MTQAPRSPNVTPSVAAVVDLYLARGSLRAEIPMLGFGRLSDVFNNAPGEFIAASRRMTSRAQDAGIVRRELVVRLRDVRLVRPIEEHSRPGSPGAVRERVPVRVVMDLDDWQVTGEVHLVDRIRWIDFAASVQNRFLSMSNASVRFAGVSEPLECEYMLINGARISSVYGVV